MTSRRGTCSIFRRFAPTIGAKPVPALLLMFEVWRCSSSYARYRSPALRALNPSASSLAVLRARPVVFKWLSSIRRYRMTLVCCSWKMRCGSEMPILSTHTFKQNGEFCEMSFLCDRSRNFETRREFSWGDLPGCHEGVLLSGSAKIRAALRSLVLDFCTTFGLFCLSREILLVLCNFCSALSYCWVLTNGFPCFATPSDYR